MNEMLGYRAMTIPSGRALLHPSDYTLSLDPDDDVVIWAFPIYSWGVPPVMLRLIENVNIKGGASHVRHYMLCTCGDDMGYADRQWKRAIEARGWEACAAYSVLMPNTYVCMKGFDVDTPEVADRKLKAAYGRVEEIAGLIKSRSCESSLHRGAMPWIKSRVVYPWFVRYKMSPKPFRATDRCVGCGQCAESCPMMNIDMVEGDGTTRPRWGAECAMCLRCYHICPCHAIAYGKATEGKGQYANSLAIAFI